MAKNSLNDTHRKWIVEQIAAWEFPTDIANAFPERFGFAITKQAMLTFMKKALKRHGSPATIDTGGLKLDGVATRKIGNADKQEVDRWINNRAENGRQPFRRRERAILRAAETSSHLTDISQLHERRVDRQLQFAI